MRHDLPSHLVRSATLVRPALGRSRLAITITGLAVLGLLATSPLAALAAGTRTVTIAASSYSPVILTVEAGTTIVFDNTSAFPHTATADNGSFDTGMIAVGSSASVTLSTPGVYPFYCQFHGAAGGVGQAGTVTVTAATPPAPTATAAGATSPTAGPGSSPAPSTAAAAPTPSAGVLGATSPTAGPGSSPLPSTATLVDLPKFTDLTGIAFAIAVAIAVGLALVIDAVRGRSARRPTR